MPDVPVCPNLVQKYGSDTVALNTVRQDLRYSTEKA